MSLQPDGTYNIGILYELSPSQKGSLWGGYCIKAVIDVSLIPAKAEFPIVCNLLGNVRVVTEAIGEICIVVEDINNDRNEGAVFCDGKTWSARTVDGAAVKKDEKVRVTEIKGVKLIVEPVSAYTEN